MRHCKNYWKNKNNVFEESKKYTSRSSFNKHSRKAYDEARKNNWLDEMTWLISKNVFVDKVDNIYRYYFKNENAIYIGRTIYPELRDYQHRTTVNDTVYKFASKNSTTIPQMEVIETNITVPQGSRKEIFWEQYYRDNGYIVLNKKKCGGVGSISTGKWSKSKCIEESKKYKTRSEFSTGNSNAYQKSIKEGWINEMIWLNNNRKYPKGFWTIKENVLEEAKKYNSKKEFEKKNISAFLAAYRYGFIKDMNWLVKQKQHKKNHWNETELKSESKKYSTRTEFSIKNRAAYNAAKKLSILDELFPKQEKKKLLRDTQKATGKTGKT